MNTYRIWFEDGSCIMVDASNRIEASTKARALKRKQDGLPASDYIDRIEKLGKGGDLSTSSAD